MFRVANLRVDPVAVELVPESIARENCTLPIRVEDGTLHVILGRRADVPELIDKLRFVLDRPIVCAVAGREHVERAIDEVYSLGAVEVENCPIDFRFPCPRRWLELEPTDRVDVRSCEGCRRDVHLCSDEGEALRKAKLGCCVAVVRVVEGEPIDLLGDVEISDGLT